MANYPVLLTKINPPPVSDRTLARPRLTAALAGAVHALFLPIIRPGITGSEFTVAALLMVLMGGIGTLSGAMIGAATFRLLSFFFERWFGEFSQVLIGVIYILIVLFFPYGVVGTLRMRSFEIQRARTWLAGRFRQALGMDHPQSR